MADLKETSEFSGLDASDAEERLCRIGDDLRRTIQDVIDAVPGGPYRPAGLARRLGIDKVLTSRVVKAVRHAEPLATLSSTPGPEPLRRLVSAASRKSVPEEYITPAERAIDQFQALIENEVGGRSALDAILSVWLPASRQEFEFKRKQAAFRAMSELLGAAVDILFETIILHPSEDGEHLDSVFLCGMLGLRRLRPGSSVKLTTMRLPQPDTPRVPRTLDGVAITSMENAVLEQFCTAPLASLEAQRSGDVVHYMLGDRGLGLHSASDLIMAEVNYRMQPRYEPKGQRAAGGDIQNPARVYNLDVLLHEDVECGSSPTLIQYLPGICGLADVNDRSRDVDRLDIRETIQALGCGLSRFRTADIPNYAAILNHVCEKTHWDGSRFRGFRCRIDYPILSAQVGMAFDAAPPS